MSHEQQAGRLRAVAAQRGVERHEVVRKRSPCSTRGSTCGAVSPACRTCCTRPCSDRPAWMRYLVHGTEDEQAEKAKVEEGTAVSSSPKTWPLGQSHDQVTTSLGYWKQLYTNPNNSALTQQVGGIFAGTGTSSPPFSVSATEEVEEEKLKPAG